VAEKRRIIYISRPWEATGLCSGCRLCELWCSMNNMGAFNPLRARIRIMEMGTGIDIPVTCQQCQNPACQAACAFDAIYFDPKLSIVRVDATKCTGCEECVGACPYGIITLDPATNTAIKCELCGGGEPACVSICPSNVLGALTNAGVSEYNRRRYAAVLAFDDETHRYMPGGEEPVMKKLERGE
jgi:anaerobic carbon-monoxide dehydrogenase iron sulfur subunit